jgi:amylovoran biosynthesis glycosyltransferase AmsE
MITKLSAVEEKFTVLLPARGDSPYILETLLSINNSSLLPNEVLLIDDGIERNVKTSILENSFRFKLKIINNKGIGLVDSLNTGLLVSKNEFIARIDADDIVYERRFEIQFDFLRANEAVSVVGTQIMYIDKLGRELGKSSYPVGQLENLKDFQAKCLMAHPSVMYRKSRVIDVGGYTHIFWNGRTDFAEDFYLWLRLARSGHCINLPEALTKYRQHSNQISSTNAVFQELATIYARATILSPSKNPFVVLNANGSIENSEEIISFVREKLGTIWATYFKLRLMTANLNVISHYSRITLIPFLRIFRRMLI